MSTITRWSLTLAVALLVIIGLVIAMLTNPRFFTGQPEAHYTPASATPAAQPEPVLHKLDPDAPQPENLTPILDEILADGDDGSHFHGSVIDIQTGDELYQHDADEPGAPASSLKTVTAIAALETLGADTELETTTTLNGDTVVLTGHGDVSLTGEKLAQLAKDTADKLAEQGIDSINVRLDDTLFGTAQHNDAWDISLYTSNNITAIYPIAMYEGRANDQPHAAYQEDPAKVALDTFVAALKDYVEVDNISRGGSNDAGEADSGAGQELASVHSEPVAELIKHMLLVSDNYLAETFGRLVAVQQGMDAADAGQAVAQVAQQHGASHVELVDTSGLAAKDRISTSDLARVLRSAARSDDPAVRNMLYSMPIAGYSGTMANRLLENTSQFPVRAKTGSLTSVATLTGVAVTADGRAVTFSFFANQPGDVLAPHTQTLDKAVDALTACGCR